MVNNAEVDQIVSKIVEQFKPDKVVLFGSYAWGKPSPDSDADLLVIKQTNQSRRERELELEHLLFNRSIPLDFLVLTPEEVVEQINQDHNLFLEDIMRNGEVLYTRPDSADFSLPQRQLTIVP